MTSLREAILEAGQLPDLQKLAEQKQSALDTRQNLEDEVAKGMALALTIVDGFHVTRK